MDRRQFLELSVIWKDEDLIELKVVVSNGRFSGITEVYDTQDSLSELATALEGFPNNNNKVLIHEAGEINSYAYMFIKLFCKDNAGHIGVEIRLEDNVSTEMITEGRDKLSLELLVEPNDIDIFQKELLRLSQKREGTATLYGNISKT